MNARASSRTLILERIRVAASVAAPVPYADLPRDYIRTGSLNRADCLRLLTERLREYDAEVTECAPDAIPAAIADCIARSGHRRIAAPPGLPAEWLAPDADLGAGAGAEWLIDHNLSVDAIESCEGVVTAATAAVADSGTIVLHHTAAEGRRLLTLLPDWHLCVLRASQVVETLPEYFARCSGPPALVTPALVTWISGPSATADIEMTRIKGVHGPRFLHVLLVRDDDAAPRKAASNASQEPA
ncbi:MAG TPA: LUD domain-containing protein [Terracidiphilus sp.]|nr:LUD domain-containing protein [Terracidiphilus sp.]